MQSIKMTKKYLTVFPIVFIAIWTFAQEKTLPEFQLKRAEVEAHLRYLASDELQGRATGEEGNNIAAAYLANYFDSLGMEIITGAPDYFQKVFLEKSIPSSDGVLEIDGTSFEQGNSVLITRGAKLNAGTKVVFANYGWVDEGSAYDDYKDLNVKGKIVITIMGTPEGTDLRTIFRSLSKKRALAMERGALALFEVFQIRRPWARIINRFSGESPLRLAPDGDRNAEDEFVYGWLNPEDKKSFITNLKKKKKIKGKISYPGTEMISVNSQNVVSLIKGSDPILSKEYVVITAHYDHVGTIPATEEDQDTIFNGARDNGMGIVALMSAAKALSQQKPKRSVIFLAVTAEELGLLGSTYYAAHPLIPLENTVFNLNTDGAGYNDIENISAIGYGRTGTDELITKGAKAFGLGIIPNPSPRQRLFDRSDNASFAEVGIPALSVGPGMTAFNEEIKKNYHQVTDEADTIDFDYFLKFCQSFTYIGRLIIDRQERPQWKTGDKYEPMGKELYGTDK